MVQQEMITEFDNNSIGDSSINMPAGPIKTNIHPALLNALHQSKKLKIKGPIRGVIKRKKSVLIPQAIAEEETILLTNPSQ